VALALPLRTHLPLVRERVHEGAVAEYRPEHLFDVFLADVVAVKVEHGHFPAQRQQFRGGRAVGGVLPTDGKVVGIVQVAGDFVAQYDQDFPQDGAGTRVFGVKQHFLVFAGPVFEVEGGQFVLYHLVQKPAPLAPVGIVFWNAHIVVSWLYRFE
jgi:hypothetical protein